jgi:drug/metabolite transporter (DMT)-like permease
MLYISAKYWLAVLMLFFACFLWGFGNVAQKIALQDISPVSLLLIRAMTALICLMPFAVHECRRKRIRFKRVWAHKNWLAMTVISFALGLACQTIGGQFTSATNLGFIINLCVLFTPLILFLAFGERISKFTLLSCLICFAGAVLLTGLHMQSPNVGDGLCLLGAVFYGVWIISLDRTLKLVDAPILITTLQFTPAIALAFFAPMPFGEINASNFWNLLPALIFVSVLSTCISFLIATHAQRLGAWLIIGEKLTTTAMLGGGLMFASILLCQFCAAQTPKTGARKVRAAVT